MTPLESSPFRVLLRILDSALSGLQGELGFGGAAPDGRGGIPRAALAADGRALLTWGEARERVGIWQIVPRSSLVSLSGGAPETSTLGGELRDADSITPVLSLDGTPSVAWTDNSGALGRIHLAREGSPDPAEPPAPDVRFSAPGSRALRGTAPLVLKVTCDAACDVLAQVAGREDLSASASLPAAGTRRLELEPIAAPIPPRRGGKVRVLLRSGAPGSRLAARSTLTLNLRRAPVVLPPRALDVTARRDGDDVATRSEDTDESRRTTVKVQG